MAFVSMLTRYCGQADCSRLLKMGPSRVQICGRIGNGSLWKPRVRPAATALLHADRKTETPAAMAPESAFELTGRYLACTLEVIDAITAEAILN